IGYFLFFAYQTVINIDSRNTVAVKKILNLYHFLFTPEFPETTMNEQYHRSIRSVIRRQKDIHILLPVFAVFQIENFLFHSFSYPNSVFGVAGKQHNRKYRNQKTVKKNISFHVCEQRYERPRN